MVARKTRLSRKSSSRRQDRLKRNNPVSVASSEPKASFSYTAEVEKPALDVKADVVSEPTFHEQLVAEEKSDLGIPLTAEEKSMFKDIPKADFDEDVKADMATDGEEVGLHKTLEKIKAGLQEEWAKLPAEKKKAGEFLHEVLYLDDDEAAGVMKTVETAKRMIAAHPDENILLKVVLREEPAEEAGVTGMVRAEDLVSFEDVEVVNPDGDVHVTPRTNVQSIIGVSSQPATIAVPPTATSYGGFGKEMGDVDEAEEAQPKVQ
jgi:hypothetical protein